MSSIDEYDATYSVERLYDSRFYKRGEATPSTNDSLKVTRTFLPSWKNFRLWRKRGLLSRWDAVRFFAVKSLADSSGSVLSFFAPLLFSVFSGAITYMLSFSFIGSFQTTFLVSALVAILSAVLLIPIFIFLDERTDKAMMDKIPEFKKTSRKITFPYMSNRSLSKLVMEKAYDLLNDSEKASLFSLMEWYSEDVNDQLNKAMDAKDNAKNSVNGVPAEKVFRDFDILIDKLFDLRDVDQNEEVLGQMKKILEQAVIRSKRAELGDSLQNLSEISEFLNTFESLNTDGRKNSRGDESSLREFGSVEVSELLDEQCDANTVYVPAGVQGKQLSR